MRPVLQHEEIAKSKQIESYGYYRIEFYFGSLNIISTADVPSHPYFPIYTFHSQVPCVESYSFYTHLSPSRKLQSLCIEHSKLVQIYPRHKFMHLNKSQMQSN